MRRLFDFFIGLFRRFQFLRYSFVGITSFIVDALVLMFVHDFFLSAQPYGLGVATALGAIVGHLCNYYLGLVVAFNSEKERKQGKNIKAFLIIAFVGAIGLLLKVVLMYVATSLFKTIDYRILNFPVAGICLVWNYLGRKVFVFKKD